MTCPEPALSVVGALGNERAYSDPPTAGHSRPQQGENVGLIARPSDCGGHPSCGLGGWFRAESQTLLRRRCPASRERPACGPPGSSGGYRGHRRWQRLQSDPDLSFIAAGPGCQPFDPNQPLKRSPLRCRISCSAAGRPLAIWPIDQIVTGLPSSRTGTAAHQTCSVHLKFLKT